MRLKTVAIATALVGCTASVPASAQQLTADQEKRIQLGIDIIKLGCGTGSSREQTQVGGKADVSLSLKKLPGVSVGGDVHYSVDEAQGLVAALQKEISSEGAKLSEKQLDCMNQYVPRIFDVLFPKGNPAPDKGHTVPPDMGVVESGQTFDLGKGKTVFLTDERITFTVIGPPVGGRSDLVGTVFEGKRGHLAAGESIAFSYSRGACKITLLEIAPGESGKFYLTCA